MSRGARGPRSHFTVRWVNLAVDGACRALNVNGDAPLGRDRAFTLPVPPIDSERVREVSSIGLW